MRKDHAKTKCTEATLKGTFSKASLRSLEKVQSTAQSSQLNGLKSNLLSTFRKGQRVQFAILMRSMRFPTGKRSTQNMLSGFGRSLFTLQLFCFTGQSYKLRTYILASKKVNYVI